MSRKPRSVECIIVESTRDIGLVSMRPTSVKPNEGGMGTTLKARLTEAGFKPGDLVRIVRAAGRKA